MQRSVIFRDDQVVTTADLNNGATFTRESMDALITDAVSNLRYYTGFGVTRSGQAEVTVAPGRYWGGGPVYQRATSTVFNFLTGTAYLPAVSGLKRIVAIVTTGETQDTDVQERSFQIDDEGNFEPQSVAMERLRYARLELVPGAVAASPVKPTIDAGLIPVAYVTLDNNGVLESNGIEQAVDYRLPSVESLKQLIAVIQTWRDQIGQIIDTIQSELITVKASIPPRIGQLLLDILARIESLENLTKRPATAVQTFVDQFISEDFSDTEASGYSAKVDFGLTFPLAASAIQPVSLVNPLDAKVKTVNNIMLPAWTEKQRVNVTGGDGELSILQYPVSTRSTVQRFLTRTVYEYEDFNNVQGRNGSPVLTSVLHEVTTRLWVEGGGATSGEGRDAYEAAYGEIAAQVHESGISKIFEIRTPDGETRSFSVFAQNSYGATIYNYRRVRKITSQEPYWDTVTTTTSASGTHVSQTTRLATDGWLTSIEFELSQIAASGDVGVLICDAVGGKPRLDSVIGRGTVAVADLVVGRNKAVINPTFIKGGRNFAVVLVSSGNHFLRTKSGNTYAQGDAFYLDDTGAWQPIQNSGDLCFGLNFAAFSQTRIEVQMTSLELAGGMSTMRLMTADREPDGTQLIWEVQRAGKWYQVSEGEPEAFSGSPNLVAFRAVFIGTQDLMPGFDVSQSEVQLGRVADTFKHVAVERDLDAASTSIQLHYEVQGWDADAHTLTPSIVVGGSPVAADSVTAYPEPSNTSRVRFVAVFAPDSTSAFTPVLDGETDTTGNYFVVTERRDISF